MADFEFEERSQSRARLLLSTFVIVCLLVTAISIVRRGFLPKAGSVTSQTSGSAPAESQQPDSRLVMSIPGSRVTIKFCWIPPGTFHRGDAKGIGMSSPVHMVTLTRGFWLSQTEITRKQWRAVVGDAPVSMAIDDLPMGEVSLLDCRDFCARAAVLFGQPIRIPTEAEWEYACRAGQETQYPGGDDVQHLDPIAWHAGSSGMQVHPVALKRPNSFGLYDMCGNVGEWTADRLYPYELEDQIDPLRTIDNLWVKPTVVTQTQPSPELKGSFTEIIQQDQAGMNAAALFEDFGRITAAFDTGVIRGGSYLSDQYHRLATYRYGQKIFERDPEVGFRIAITPSAIGVSSQRALNTKASALSAPIEDSRKNVSRNIGTSNRRQPALEPAPFPHYTSPSNASNNTPIVRPTEPPPKFNPFKQQP